MPTVRNFLTGLMAFAVLGVVLIGIVDYCIVISKLEASKEWRIIPQQQWPETLPDLLREAKQEHVNFGGVTVLHQAYSGAYVWKSHYSPELVALMVARWKLSSVKGKHESIRYVLEHLPSCFSTLRENNDATYYVSANWWEGDKGHQYCVILDKNQDQIIVRYYYNW
jgi:hypothetical protein